jgi:nitrogen fixation/metabolism regulation signal transduction histidine kinase
MDLFQGEDATFWLWMSIILTVLVAAATWYYTIVGVDRKPRHQERGEHTIERYGDIEEDRAPVPKFLVLTYIGVAIWAVAYAIWTGVKGTGI